MRQARIKTRRAKKPHKPTRRHSSPIKWDAVVAKTWWTISLGWWTICLGWWTICRDDGRPKPLIPIRLLVRHGERHIFTCKVRKNLEKSENSRRYYWWTHGDENHLIIIELRNARPGMILTPGSLAPFIRKCSLGLHRNSIASKHPSHEGRNSF